MPPKRRSGPSRAEKLEDLSAPRLAVGAEERVRALDRTGPQLFEPQPAREIGETKAAEVDRAERGGTESDVGVLVGSLDAHRDRRANGRCSTGRSRRAPRRRSLPSPAVRRAASAAPTSTRRAESPSLSVKAIRRGSARSMEEWMVERAASRRRTATSSRSRAATATARGRTRPRRDGLDDPHRALARARRASPASPGRAHSRRARAQERQERVCQRAALPARGIVGEPPRSPPDGVARDQPGPVRARSLLVERRERNGRLVGVDQADLAARR